MAASATESILYRSSVKWHEAGKAPVNGIVSRYIEFYIINYFPSIFTKWSADQKSELVVFVVAKGGLLFGFKTASSDLWGANMASFLGFDPDAALLGAGAAVNDKSWGSYFTGGLVKP